MSKKSPSILTRILLLLYLLLTHLSFHPCLYLTYTLCSNLKSSQLAWKWPLSLLHLELVNLLREPAFLEMFQFNFCLLMDSKSSCSDTISSNHFDKQEQRVLLLLPSV